MSSAFSKEHHINRATAIQNLDATDVIEINGKCIEILDIRREGHRKRAAEILARGLVMVWLRTTPGLIGDAYNEKVAQTIQRVKGQSNEALRGNVMSIAISDVPKIVDTKRHHWSIRWLLENHPQSLIAKEGGNFWNVYPRPGFAEKYPWLTKPQVTSGESTVVINVHNDAPMGALIAQVRAQKQGDFAIEGTSAQPHGHKQITHIEDLDPSIFEDENVAYVILDASHIDDTTRIAKTAAPFPIFDLTGYHAGGQEFSLMRSGGYPIPTHMRRLLRVLRTQKVLGAVVNNLVPYRERKKH